MNKFLTFLNLSFIISLTTFLLACNGQAKSQDFKANTKTFEVIIDTSFWLKETRGIHDILEDNNGNLWFSSPDYVAKFDGKAMHYFSENDGLNIVGNLHKDINGTIWIEDGFKLYKYNGKRFTLEKLDNKFVSSYRNPNGLWLQKD